MNTRPGGVNGVAHVLVCVIERCKADNDCRDCSDYQANRAARNGRQRRAKRLEAGHDTENLLHSAHDGQKQSECRDSGHDSGCELVESVNDSVKETTRQGAFDLTENRGDAAHAF